MAADLVRVVIESLQELGGWDPQDVKDLDATLEALPNLGEAFEGALRRMAETIRDKEGLSDSVAEHLDDAATVTGSVTDEIREAYETHRTEHAFWLGEE